MIRFTLLDTETTGLEGHCIQLAFKTFEDGVLKEEFNELFCPPCPIDPGAERVHGISMKMLKDKPKLSESETFLELQLMFNSTIVVAHNADFDISILKRDGFEIPFHICTQKLAKMFYPKLAKHKLQTLKDDLKIDIETKAHDAMGDVMLLEKIFEKIFEEGIRRFPDLDAKAVLARLVTISRQPRSHFYP